MSRKEENYNYNPRLAIVNHFDDIINKIDVKTETSLEKIEMSNKNRKLKNEATETKQQNGLNETREKQIKKIKEIEQINLQLLNDKSTKEFEQKWSHVINDHSLDFEKKMDQIKEDLIHFDCVLLEHQEKSNPFILWITSWYYNKKDLEFLK